MKTTLYTFLLFLCCITINAQHKIEGRILEKNDTPIDYAEIQLLQGVDKLVSQVFTNTDGIFKIENTPSGNYTLKVIYLGQTLNQQDIVVSNNIDLKDIIVTNDQKLDEIILQAEKKLVERKVDRLVYNTANSVASQGMDAIEALSNTPMVKVVDDKISIVGKNNVSIMVDDRPLYLSGDALTNYLKTLRSDDIEKIEVITAPPAKYEASGNSGIINIVMKANKTMGVYGTVSGSYSYNNKISYGTNGSINYQNKKWNIMLKANKYDGKYQSENRFTYTDSKSGYISESTNTGTYKNAGVNLTTNYQINKNSLIGMSYNFTRATGDNDNMNSTAYLSYPFAQTDSLISSSNIGDNSNNYHTANLFYELKLDTLGSKLSIGANYFSTAPDKTTTIKDYNAISTVKNQLYFTNELDYSVWSANADLAYKLSWADIELGTKYTYYDNKSTVDYFNFKNSEYHFDNTKSNRFNYQEDNYAGYFSISKQLSEKWQVKGGLRYEYTEAKGNLLDTNEKFTKSYGKWFPTAYISFDPNDTHSFSFNYSKRINRPNSSILNPFRYYTNVYSYDSGNPELNPAITNNYELSYVYDSTLSFTLSYSHLSDSFDQLSIFEDGIMSSKYYNMLNTEYYGIDVSYSNKVLSWWETNTGADFYYTTSYYNTSDAPQIPQNGSTFSYYSMNTFNINSAKTLKLLLNWNHTLPNKEDNTKYNKYQTLTSGIKLNLLDSKLSINTTIYDIFNTGKSSGTMYYRNNTQTFSNKWNSRRFNISVSYNFGNTKNKKEIIEVDFEDKNRSN